MLKRLSTLSCVTFFGSSITTFGDSGLLETDCWATESAHSVVLSWLRLDPTLSASSITDPDVLELPLVSSNFTRLCLMSASVFLQSFSRARLCSSSSFWCIFRCNSCSCCCFKRNSSSRCCCCCKRNSSCWRQSFISSSSCSNFKSRSCSCCSVSFLTLKFLSSISTICRLLEDLELVILGCFLLSCVVKSLKENLTFS